MTRRLEILDSELRTTVITITVKHCSGKDGKHGKSGRYFQQSDETMGNKWK